MRHLLIISLLAVFAFSQDASRSGGKAGKPQQKQVNAAQRLASVEQRGTEERPLVVKTIPLTKTQAEAEQEEKDRKEKAANDRNLVVATLILAAIGVLQLFVFGYQAVQLRKTLTTMRETAESQLRAYVFPVGAQKVQDPSGNFRIKVVIKNSGQTPAYSCISWCGVGISTFPVAAPFPDETPDPGTYSIAPGAEVELGGPMDPMTSGQQIAISNATHAVYAFGRIRYVDAFHKQRFTDFRMFCTVGALVLGRFMFSKEGNKAT